MTIRDKIELTIVWSTFSIGVYAMWTGFVNDSDINTIKGLLILIIALLIDRTPTRR